MCYTWNATRYCCYILTPQGYSFYIFELVLSSLTEGKQYVRVSISISILHFCAILYTFKITFRMIRWRIALINSKSFKYFTTSNKEATLTLSVTLHRCRLTTIYHTGVPVLCVTLEQQQSQTSPVIECWTR